MFIGLVKQQLLYCFLLALYCLLYPCQYLLADGCAIAHGVSKHLLKRGCQTIFSTHYHELMREYVNEPAVIIYHMGVIEQVRNLLHGIV